MSLFILLVFLFVRQAAAAEDLDPIVPPKIAFRPFSFSVKDLDEVIADFLPDNDLVIMTYVSKYWALIIPKSKSWNDIAEKRLKIKISEHFAFFRIDYLPNCFRYTFKGMGAVSSDYTGLQLSDDRSTVVLTKWERLQTPKTIIRNSQFTRHRSRTLLCKCCKC